ncbi:uncharacterized protein LOC129600011 [Paramacrobiotus metropolitanus]|uniref:uncharacterized protein LOC129600011 n=1 Tax=Paramacrobiotus metropolitanus TaxID=2943436 RepID=UPI002446496D|nr:uncharacterized protein LOC129600011 [Paramacrobiotus metropolitanus]
MPNNCIVLVGKNGVSLVTFFDAKLRILSTVLHPAFKIEALHCNPSVVNYQIIRQWSNELYKQLFPNSGGILSASIAAYLSKSTPFDEEIAAGQDIRPFWVISGTVYKELSNLALLLYDACPHAAGLERIWSSMGTILTKPRNRLDIRKTNDLAKVKLNIIRERRMDLAAKTHIERKVTTVSLLPDPVVVAEEDLEVGEVSGSQTDDVTIFMDFASDFEELLDEPVAENDCENHQIALRAIFGFGLLL